MIFLLNINFSLCYFNFGYLWFGFMFKFKVGVLIMKFNRKIFKMFLSLCFVMSFCVMTSAMQSISDNATEKSVENKEDIEFLRKKLFAGMRQGQELLSRFNVCVDIKFKYKYKVFECDGHCYFINTYIFLKKILKEANLFKERIANEIFFNLINNYYDEGIRDIIGDNSFLVGVVRLFLNNREDANKIINAVKNTKLDDIKIFEKDLEDAKRDFCSFMKASNEIKGNVIRKLKEIDEDKTDLSSLNYFIDFREMQKKELESKKSKFVGEDLEKIEYSIKCYDKFIKLLRSDMEKLLKNEGNLSFITKEGIRDAKKIMITNNIAKNIKLLKNIEEMQCNLQYHLNFKGDFYNLSKFLTLDCLNLSTLKK